jgi:hypothetical protein
MPNFRSNLNRTIAIMVTGPAIATTTPPKKIRSEGKRNRRVEIALHDNPPT